MHKNQKAINHQLLSVWQTVLLASSILTYFPLRERISILSIPHLGKSFRNSSVLPTYTYSYY